MRNRTHSRHEHRGHDHRGHEPRRFAHTPRDGASDPRHDHDHDRGDHDRGHGRMHGGRGRGNEGWGHEGRGHGGRGHDGHTHEGHTHEGRGGGRRGRVFDHGDLRLVMLQLIADKPRHGYEIIKAIEDLVGGAYSPSPGVVYPTLTMLEELGHVTMTEQDGKKLHALTDQGRAYLAENRAAIDALQARMAEIAAARADTPPPTVIRAIENLKLALRLRQKTGPLSDEQMQKIVAALDAATVAIERS